MSNPRRYQARFWAFWHGVHHGMSRREAYRQAFLVQHAYCTPQVAIAILLHWPTVLYSDRRSVSPYAASD